MYDIAIIGLGPAGATAARLLSDRFSVVAIDTKSGRESSFHKPCGGLLAPDAQKALARFALTLPKEVLVDPQIFSVRTIDLNSKITRYYRRFYLNIDRHKFDRWMISLIPPTVEIYEDSRCYAIEEIRGGYRIHFYQSGFERTVDAAWIIGADGASSMVRKRFFPNKKIRSYVAIQQWFPDFNANPFYSCIFDRKATDCYSWSISKDGYFIFGGAYPSSHCQERFETQKKRLQKMGFAFGDPVKTEACMVLRPAYPWQFCTGNDRVFLIGEAAGWISPSSLEGISSAIISASMLSDALLTSDNPDRAYRRKSLLLRIKHSAKLIKCPALFFPPFRHLIMKSGIGAIPVREEK